MIQIIIIRKWRSVDNIHPQIKTCPLKLRNELRYNEILQNSSIREKMRKSAKTFIMVGIIWCIDIISSLIGLRFGIQHTITLTFNSVLDSISYLNGLWFFLLDQLSRRQVLQPQQQPQGQQHQQQHEQQQQQQGQEIIELNVIGN